MAWLAGWDKRIEIKIEDYANDIGAEVTWWPATVFLTSIQCEEVFTELTTDAEYKKVAFTKADGTTELYGECELFTHYAPQYPPAQSDTYVKSTEKATTDHWAYFATDPTKSLTGVWTGNAWIAEHETITNQRFHIDLGNGKIIKKIYYENSHHSGTVPNSGVNNFTFWGSNTGAGTFDDLVWVNDEGWTELTVSQNTFDKHSGADEADPKYITVTNSTAYRYYAFKFADNYGDADWMGVRHIELQSEDAVYHVSRDGWVINANTSVFMYYDKDHADNDAYIGLITARTEVWDGNTEGHWDMAQDPDGDGANAIKDGTSNTRHLTPVGSMTTADLVTGKVGKGIDFEGTDDGLVKAVSDVGLTNAWTMSSWIKLDTDIIGSILNFLEDTATTVDNRIQLFRPAGTETIISQLDKSTGGYIKAFQSNGVINEGTWYFVSSTWDGTDLHIYIDGSQSTPYTKDVDLTGSQTNTNRITYIGYVIWDSIYIYPWDGIIDETSYASVARSAAWIKGLYNSGNDSLFTYGSEEEAPVEINVINFGANF